MKITKTDNFMLFFFFLKNGSLKDSDLNHTMHRLKGYCTVNGLKWLGLFSTLLSLAVTETPSAFSHYAQVLMSKDIRGIWRE